MSFLREVPHLTFSDHTTPALRLQGLSSHRSLLPFLDYSETPQWQIQQQDNEFRFRFSSVSAHTLMAVITGFILDPASAAERSRSERRAGGVRVHTAEPARWAPCAAAFPALLRERWRPQGFSSAPHSTSGQTPTGGWVGNGGGRRCGERGWPSGAPCRAQPASVRKRLGRRRAPTGCAGLRGARRCVGVRGAAGCAGVRGAARKPPGHHGGAHLNPPVEWARVLSEPRYQNSSPCRGTPRRRKRLTSFTFLLQSSNGSSLPPASNWRILCSL